MQNTKRLDFKLVTIGDYSRIYPYTSAYGEGSCQHSPVSMYSLSEKYGDAVCEEDGVLYTLRQNLCDADFRVYLAPLGGCGIETAFARILDDAASYGRRVEFLSLTERYAAALENAFPGRFTITEDRDLAEYIYNTEQMANYAGHELQTRRREVRLFWRANENRCAITRIRPEDSADVLAFEQLWLARNREDHDAVSLDRESRMIEKQLRDFDELRLSGIVLRLDGRVHGFGYGTKLSDRYYDVLAEKGDKDIPHIYKVLRQELAKQCALDCEYFNMEEDVGVPGLRIMKNRYCPAFLLRKYVAKERVEE